MFRTRRSDDVDDVVGSSKFRYLHQQSKQCQGVKGVVLNACPRRVYCVFLCVLSAMASAANMYLLLMCQHCVIIVI